MLMTRGHLSNREVPPMAETRSISRVGMLELDGWSCRIYHIRRRQRYVEDDAISSAIDLATTSLPDASTNHRVGVAFLLLHHGTDHWYAVLCFWQNRNELITRVWTRPHGSEAWTDACQKASFCIWDMLVLDAERSLFIERFLQSHHAASANYAASWPDPGSLQRDGLLQVVYSENSFVETARKARPDAVWNDGPDIVAIENTR